MPDVTSAPPTPTDPPAAASSAQFPTSPTTEPAALIQANANLAAATRASTRAATVPAYDYDAGKGDIFRETKHAIDSAGLTETVYQTPFTGWLIFLFGLCAGLVVGRVVGIVLSRAASRAAERVRLIRAVLIGSFVGPISLMLFLIGLGFGLAFLRLSPPLRTFLKAGFQFMSLVWIGWLLYNLIDLVTIVLGRWSRGRQGNLSVMLVPLARKTLRVMLVTMLLLFAAENIFGQDVKTLLAGLGIAGLAVSLAAQDTLRNLFGSIMIFADQPFAIGDSVKITDMEGCVEDIGFRSTRLRTADGFVATIPNGNIAGSAVLNYSRRRGIRRSFDVTLPAEATPDQMAGAMTLLREALADPDLTPGFDPKHPPSVVFDDPTQRRARVTYWYRNNDLKAYVAHAERLNLEIVGRFHKAGIAFK